jgi:hypothetical protein
VDEDLMYSRESNNHARLHGYDSRRHAEWRTTGRKRREGKAQIAAQVAVRKARKSLRASHLS